MFIPKSTWRECQAVVNSKKYPKIVPTLSSKGEI